MKVVMGGEITKDTNELKALFGRKLNPVAYDGFEPSGRMHIAQGLLRSMNVNELTGAGVKFVFWVADYFALMNLKLGGDLEKIQNCGRYLIQVWKACGMDMTNVEFVWASEFINRNPDKYWFNVMQIAMHNKISRIKRCGMAMGREASDSLACSQLFYPCMQCNDIFQLRCDITSLGKDQRKVNMLAREYCDLPDKTGLLEYLGRDKRKRVHKPVILSHHMLAGLTGLKMAKSDPNSAIFMEDTAKDVQRKIKKAWCPPGVLAEKRMEIKEGKNEPEEVEYTNGCMEYAKYIVFPALQKQKSLQGFRVSRSAEHGGHKEYKTYAEVEADFVALTLHPDDLKTALAKALNTLLQPVRVHFQKDPMAKELLVKMKQYMRERARAKGKNKNKGNKSKGNKSKGKKSKGKSGKGASQPPVYDLEDDAVISCLDIRVGNISNARMHPSFDTLYVEDVDIGESQPRTVCTGLRKTVPIDKIAGPCIVLTNLRARKMGGVKSQAMVLAAVSADGTAVELLRPPVGAPVGAQVVFESKSGFGGFASGKKLDSGKGKAALLGILADKAFCTNDKKEAGFRGNTMLVEVKEGDEPQAVTVPTLTNGKIK